jgi:hypothetical protein
MPAPGAGIHDLRDVGARKRQVVDGRARPGHDAERRPRRYVHEAAFTKRRRCRPPLRVPPPAAALGAPSPAFCAGGRRHSLASLPRAVLPTRSPSCPSAHRHALPRAVLPTRSPSCPPVHRHARPWGGHPRLQGTLLRAQGKTWMAGPGPAMTPRDVHEAASTKRRRCRPPFPAPPPGLTAGRAGWSDLLMKHIAPLLRVDPGSPLRVLPGNETRGTGPGATRETPLSRADRSGSRCNRPPSP